MNNYRTLLPSEQTINIGSSTLILYCVEDNQWFLTDKHVADAYGVTPVAIKRHFQNHKNHLEEGEHWVMTTGKPGSPPTRLWTKDGLIKLGNFVKSEKAEALLIELGVVSRHTTKIESEYCSILSASFDGIYPFQYQYEVAGCKIDMYFPTLNVAVEIDEHGHPSYDKLKEDTREAIIKAKLKCDVIRFNPHASGNNIGKLINLILKRQFR